MNDNRDYLSKDEKEYYSRWGGNYAFGVSSTTDYEDEEELSEEDKELKAYLYLSQKVPYEWAEEFCTCANPEYENKMSLEDSQKIQDVSNKRFAKKAQEHPDRYQFTPEEYLNYKTETRLRDYDHCSKCGKRARWQLLTCSRCGKIHDWKFKHHATQGAVADRSIPRGWAWAKSICWTCITKEDPAVEGDSPPQFITAPRGPAVLSFDVDDFTL